MISCESYIGREENSLRWYLKNTEEVLLGKVGDSSVLNTSEALDSKVYKANEAKETTWRANGSRKEHMSSICMSEKRKVLTGIELHSGLQEEI